MNDRYLKQFKKGILEIVVLKFLSVREMYGYELISEINEKSRFLEIKEGTLYPILYRLEDDGMMETRWEQAAARGIPKKYYGITAKGRDELKSASEVWLQFTEDIENILKEEVASHE